MSQRNWIKLLLLVILITNVLFLIRIDKITKEVQSLNLSNDSLRKHIGHLYRDPVMLVDSILTPANVMKYIRLKGIKWPKVVWAQAMVETGYFTCDNCCLQYNNLFGFMIGSKECMKFDKWQESVDYYAKWQRKSYTKDIDYFTFLTRIKYAGFKEYNTHIAQILMDNKMVYDNK